MKKNGLTHRQQGMTLIEIMIALLLGAFLLAGILQIFLSTKQTYRMQDNISRLQENGRFAMEFITRDLRMAGYFGCLGNVTAANIENEMKDQSNTAWDVLTPLMGYNDVDNTFAVFTNVVVNTDVIVMMGLAAGGTPLISPFSNSAQMFVDPNFNADCPAGSATTCHEGEILMVTDCSQGTIFQTTQTTNIGGTPAGVNIVHSANNTFTPGNAAPATFTRTYGQGSQIARLLTYGYYIRQNAAAQPSLYRSTLVVTSNEDNAFGAEELVEGIENLQILYGEDTDTPKDGTPNYYVDADNVADMDDVVGLRIVLTARTMDANLTNTGDGRLRRTFSTTILLRNRL